MDMAEDWAIWSQKQEGKALISLAETTNGKLIMVNCVPDKIGVDEGTMLTVNAGVYNVRNDDG
jgi:glyceraldehyde-3-phosphate dehydrogenase/erythrose-4-phosphate dehydrogenase